MSLKIYKRLVTEPASANVLIETLAEGVTNAAVTGLTAETGYTYTFQREGVAGKVFDPVTYTASTIAGTVTPAAPTISADDSIDTLSASHALGDSEIVVSENDGAYVAYTGQIIVGDVARAAGYWKFKIKAATGRNESAVAASPAFTVAQNTTPAAPTVTADDSANTLSASHALGISEILVSENDGAYTAYSGQIAVGNVARAASYWKFKVKAAAGRNESAVAGSPAFTYTAPPSLSGTELVHTLPLDTKYGDAVVAPDGIAYFTSFDSKKIERVDLNTWTTLTPLVTLTHSPVGISLYGDTLLVSRSGANGWFEVDRFTGAVTTKSTLASGRKVVRIGEYYYIQAGTGFYVASSTGAFIVQPNAGTNTYDLAIEGEYLYVYRASFISRTLPYLPDRPVAFTSVSGTSNTRYASGRFLMTPQSVVIALDASLTSDVSTGNVGNNIFAYSRDFASYYGGAKVPDEAYTNALFRFGQELYGVTLPGKIYRVLSNTPI